MTGERRFRVAVVGATGLVGREIVSLLAERAFPVAELLFYASEKSEGETVEFGEEELVVHRLPPELPAVDVAFLCATAEVSRALSENLSARGATVIDLTAAGRAQALAALLAAPLRAIAGAAPLRRVIVTAIVSASAYGRSAVESLGEETVALLNSQEYEGEASGAFRCLPEGSAGGGRLAPDVERELGRLFGASVPISIDVIRSPTFYAHGASVSVETAEPLALDAARDALRQAPSVVFDEAPKDTLSAAGADAIYVGALGCDADDARWIRFWAAADNVRQGALQAVALAEAAVRNR